MEGQNATVIADHMSQGVASPSPLLHHNFLLHAKNSALPDGSKMVAKCLSFTQHDGSATGSLPSQGTCPGCGKLLSWLDALKSSGNVGWKNNRTKKRCLPPETPPRAD